ncbi:hypothetical protein ABPG72_014981 [Tetrahymena utriculariae]
MIGLSKSENYRRNVEPYIFGGKSIQPGKNTILDISDYLNLNTKHSLGKGSAGKVLKVYDFQIGKEQAIKLYEDENYFQTERNIINGLPKGLPVLQNLSQEQQEIYSFLLRNQESIIPQGYRFRNDLFIENRQRLALIMDVYDTNLAQYIQYIVESNDFSIEERIYIAKVIFAKIFLCVYHLHQNGLIHCDISLDNFLVNKNPDQETLQIFINDFNHTKTQQNAIIDHKLVSGKHFPPEIQITGSNTCVILTPDHIINAKRLDFYSLFCCYFQIFGILQIPKENIDLDTQFVMLYFYQPHANYDLNCQEVIKKILDLKVNEEFIRYLLIDTYDFPDGVIIKNLENQQQLIDTLHKLQQDKRIFDNLVLNFIDSKEKNLLQFDFQVFYKEESYRFNEINQQDQIKQQLAVDYILRERNATVLYDPIDKYLCFSFQENQEYQIQQTPQWFERFKKLVLQAIGENHYEELYFGLNQQPTDS